MLLLLLSLLLLFINDIFLRFLLLFLFNHGGKEEVRGTVTCQLLILDSRGEMSKYVLDSCVKAKNQDVCVFVQAPGTT